MQLPCYSLVMSLLLMLLALLLLSQLLLLRLFRLERTGSREPSDSGGAESLPGFQTCILVLHSAVLLSLRVTTLRGNLGRSRRESLCQCNDSLRTARLGVRQASLH